MTNMNAKIITHNQDARLGMLTGVNKLANAVRSTLGPSGCNVVITRQFGAPIITKDGVTVARDIELSDPIENAGALLVKEVAEKAVEEAGDGTTTSTVLAQAIMQGGFKAIENGARQIDIKRGIDKCAIEAVKLLETMSIECKDLESIRNVATISANSEKSVGNVVSEAIDKVGLFGVVNVEAAAGMTDEIEIETGISFDNGYTSNYFCNNDEGTLVEFNNPLIIMHSGNINNIKDLLPILEYIVKVGKESGNLTELLIIADDFNSEVLTTLVSNNISGVLKVCAVKSPAYAERKIETLKDIAVMTGGEVLGLENGLKLENINLQTHTGQCRKVIIDKNSTKIIDGAGEESEIHKRAEVIKKQIEECDTDFNKERTKERLAKMSSGVATIKVGAGSEAELNEKMDRIDDALCATRAAIEEGVVAGGGTTLVKIAHKLKNLKGDNDDQTIGIKILLKAFTSPLTQIVTNCGLESAIVLSKVTSKRHINIGYNAVTDKYVDMISEGILDPTKVTRCAIQFSSSVAGTMLTTNCIITDDEEIK